MKTTIKAVLINPFAQFLSKRIEEIDLKIRENGDLILSELYKYLDCDLVQFVQSDNLVLIVDEEGLLKENTFFKIKDFGQEIFAGKGLLIKGNGYRYISTTEEDIKDLTITFPSAKEAIEQLEGED